MSGGGGSPRTPWHVCFVVTDVEAAAREFTDGLGVSWGEVTEYDEIIQDADGASLRLATRGVFSRETPLAIELMEPVAGTPFVQRGDSPFHHIAYWTEDVDAETQRLDQLSLPCLALAGSAAGQPRAFHEGPYGVLLEACGVSAPPPGMEQFLPKGIRL
ncbi:VOC family protein [Streptomyces sp. NPDC057137]|uniref:VOC family protein n=1 Tax=Streptomyces sp. NPDC057137 TaxID=3346030 RepID=UPI0036398CF4